MEFLRGLGILLALQAATSVASFVILRLTPRWPRARAVFLLTLPVLYHLILIPFLSSRTVLILGAVFMWLDVTFTCRLLSSIYFYNRSKELPGPFFHVIWLVTAPRMHYEASGWGGLEGERFSGKLLKQWGGILLYTALITLIAGLLILAGYQLRFPGHIVVVRGAFFLLGLEALATCLNLTSLAWSFRGYHKSFVGNFAWFRSVHIGQFWRSWNPLAVLAFQEVGKVLNFPRRSFMNTMAVFLVSGLLHQIAVYYYIRVPSYGTAMSFLFHGVFVYVFGHLHHARDRIPAPFRLLVFNPATSAAVTLLACQPFVMDFYKEFTFSF